MTRVRGDAYNALQLIDQKGLSPENDVHDKTEEQTAAFADSNMWMDLYRKDVVKRCVVHRHLILVALTQINYITYIIYIYIYI